MVQESGGLGQWGKKYGPFTRLVRLKRSVFFEHREGSMFVIGPSRPYKGLAMFARQFLTAISVSSSVAAWSDGLGQSLEYTIPTYQVSRVIPKTSWIGPGSVRPCAATLCALLDTPGIPAHVQKKIEGL